MKRKIFILGLLCMLATMMTSCLVVFPDELDCEYEYSYSTQCGNQQNYYGTVYVTNNTRDGYVSEISYSRDDGASWQRAWDDGHEYVYLDGSSRACSGNTICTKVPTGTYDIRVTVIYSDRTWEDFIFENNYISKNRVTNLTVENSMPCPR
ncbi:MAG: hypothetical protein SOW31_02720 [Treponema sp.]|nr:hypothetical protein [Spirochaetia bacterium]MDD7767402.1 hypothetical protein [Treponema sp.]MDY3130619.1 hypothetical protein [Treponema sp.]